MDTPDILGCSAPPLTDWGRSNLLGIDFDFGFGSREHIELDFATCSDTQDAAFGEHVAAIEYRWEESLLSLGNVRDCRDM